MDCQNSDEAWKFDVSGETAFCGVGISTKTSLNKISPLITIKEEFECRDKFKLISFLVFSDCRDCDWGIIRIDF